MIVKIHYCLLVDAARLDRLAPNVKSLMDSYCENRTLTPPHVEATLNLGYRSADSTSFLVQCHVQRVYVEE